MPNQMKKIAMIGTGRMGQIRMDQLQLVKFGTVYMSIALTQQHD